MAPGACPNPKLEIFQFLFESVESFTNHYVSGTASNIIAAITPVAMTLFLIFVVLWALALMRNQIEEPITDGTMRLIKVAIVLGIALNSHYYGMMIVHFVMETPAHLIAAANGNDLAMCSGSHGIALSLDTALDKIFGVGMHAWEKAGLTSLGYVFAALIIWIAGIFMLLFAAGIVLLCKIATVVLLALGPIFIMMTLFKGTHRFFELWMGQLLNFMLTLVMTVLMTGVLLGIVDEFLTTQLDTSSGAAVVLIQMFAIGGVATLVLRQVPQMGAALAGGIAMSTMGAFGAATRGIGSTAGKAGRQAWNKGTKQDARKHAAHLKAQEKGKAMHEKRAAGGKGMASAYLKKNSIKRG